MFSALSFFQVVIGQRSIIDLPHGLYFADAEAVKAFIQSYGFNTDDPSDQSTLLWFYRRSWNYLRDVLGLDPAKVLPEEFEHFQVFLDEVLIKPFTPEGKAKLKAEKPQLVRDHRQMACAILRVMHAFVHAQTDILGYFAETVLKHTLDPFLRHVHHDGASGKPYFEGLLNGYPFRLPLELVETKPQKTSVSTVTKLLAKAETHMMHIYDRVGIRFVVSDVAEGLILIQMLIENQVFNPAHVMVEQTTNETYPVDLLTEFLKQYTPTKPIHEWESGDFQTFNQQLKAFLEQHQDSAQWVTKPNPYSAGQHRFIKFVGRRLIQLGRLDNQMVKLFYPFEVQILTWSQHLESLKPDVQHESYKKRQLEQTKARVWAFDPQED